MRERQRQPWCHHSAPLPLLLPQCLPTSANPAVLPGRSEVVTIKVLFQQRKSNSVPPCTIHQGLLYLSWFSNFSRFPLQEKPPALLQLPQLFSQSYFGTHKKLYVVQCSFFKLGTPNTHLLTLA